MEGNDPMRTFSVTELQGMAREGCQGHAEANAAIAELCRRADCTRPLYQALCRLVGGGGEEGDLYDSRAHAAARSAISMTERA